MLELLEDLAAYHKAGSPGTRLELSALVDNAKGDAVLRKTEGSDEPSWASADDQNRDFNGSSRGHEESVVLEGRRL